MANVVNRWTEDEQRLGVAALARYGPTMAARMLSDVMEHAPTRFTLANWGRDVVPTEEDTQFWVQREAQMRSELFARTSTLIPRVADVIERLTDPDIPLDDVPAGKLQHATISYGILHDKLVPTQRSAGSLIGNAEHVTLNVIAPESVDRATRDARPIEAEFRIPDDD